FVTTTVSMIIWVIVQGKCMIAFCQDCEAWKVAITSTFFLMISIPFGAVIGCIVSPAIYKGCELSGPGRDADAIYVHIIVGTVVGTTFLFLDRFQLYTGLWLIVAYPVMVSILCAPWVAVPSMIGALAYAHWSVPAVRNAAA